MSDSTEPGDSADVVPITEAKQRRSGRRSAAPYVAPALPSVFTLLEEHRQHLALSAIDSSELDLAQVHSETDRARIAALLGRSNALPGGAAIVFPFFEPGETQPYGYRIRPDHPRRGTNARTIKYDQASLSAGVGTLVLFPPRAAAERAYQETVTDLYAVEGEKKAYVLDQLGYTTIGLTGVWNWLDPDRDKRTGDELHPLIRKHCAIRGRRCVIVFDNDARTNSQVLKAARRLAGAYYAAGAAEVLFITPPDYGVEKGIDDYFAANGAEATHALLASAQPLSPVDPNEIANRPLSDYPPCEGAPVPDGYVIPRGYAINVETGAVSYARGERTVEVSSAPILISSLQRDADSGEEHAEVTYKRFGTWRRVLISRRALADNRTMVNELAPVGAPMHAGHAKALLQWFAALELANEARLLPIETTNRTGWREDGVTTFMLGMPLCGGLAASQLRPGPQLSMFAAALTPRGTLDGHLTALRALWAASPAARMMLCAALAAPLLRPLEQSGFCLHLFGDTTTGKSTLLRAAASVYGDPTQPSWCGTWNISQAAAEARAIALNDLPMCLDEIGVTNRPAVQELVYSLINGQGRSRASKDASLRRLCAWRTVVLSTGEVSLSDVNMPTGVQARVLDVHMNGLGRLNGNRAEIAQLSAACVANAGALGREWLTSLIQSPPDYWQWLRAELADNQAAKGNNHHQSRGRQQASVALLQLVEGIICDSFGFASGDLPTVTDEFESDDVREVKPAHEHMADVLEEWLFTRMEAFPIAERTVRGGFALPHSAYSREMLGVRIYEGGREGTLIETLIVPGALRELCAEHGHSCEHVLRSWAEHGWIEVDASSGRTHRTVQRSQRHGPRSRWIAWRGRPEVETDEK